MSEYEPALIPYMKLIHRVNMPLRAWKVISVGDRNDGALRVQQDKDCHSHSSFVNSFHRFTLFMSESCIFFPLFSLLCFFFSGLRCIVIGRKE